MPLILTYECPECEKQIRDTKHVVQRHKDCPKSKRASLYVLTKVEVE